ncbi:MAG: histidinol dehydrogenase [Thermodesulfobacteriota bacterium]
MKIIDSKAKGFSGFFRRILERGEGAAGPVEESVKEILSGVKTGGDRAVRGYTKKFDGVDIRGGFRVSESEIKSALKKVSKRDKKLLELAASRIEAFHRRQLRNSWFFTEEDGTLLGTRITPLERVALYVPGGKASYPSTVLMNAIPARVAGVKEVFMTTPPGPGGISPTVLAAAAVAGVDRVYRIGGAQAVGAFAYGTATVPGVDKITGPGNIYVATAKRLVYGVVDIDMVAGPSEILIINDGTGDASWMASDLLGQAEHDELASSVIITTSRKTALAVKKEVQRQLERIKPLKRRRIAESSISDYGAIITVKDLAEATRLSNEIAPEHLELFVENPFELLGSIRNAGAVFLGRNTPEAAGDYMAGPNHTLPTGGTARFSSPLGVDDFIKKTSVMGFSEKGIKALGPDIERFARIEGLTAHAASVKKRI